MKRSVYYVIEGCNIRFATFKKLCVSLNCLSPAELRQFDCHRIIRFINDKQDMSYHRYIAVFGATFKIESY